MNAYLLTARCLDGGLLEIGAIARLESACRIRRALEDELGEEYLGFSIEEIAADVTCRALTYDELRPRRDARRGSRALAS
jgi:hypothetical protein